MATREEIREGFKVFQYEFKEWQLKFGLSSYQVYFRYEPIGDSFASITVNQPEWVATVRYNSRPTEDALIFLDVKKSARHEVIHLLLSKLEFMADSRFVTPEEIDTEIEALVNRIEELINEAGYVATEPLIKEEKDETQSIG